MVEVTVPLELLLGLLHPVMTVAKPKGISNETIFFVNTLWLFKVLDNTGQAVEVRDDEASLELICAA